MSNRFTLNIGTTFLWTKTAYTMDSIQLNIKQVFGFLSDEVILNQAGHAAAMQSGNYTTLTEGSDFLGWVNLPSLQLPKKISGKLKMRQPYCARAATPSWWWVSAVAIWGPVR